MCKRDLPPAVEDFPDRSIKTYFVAMPSGIELFQGWKLTERPLDIVLAEQMSVIKIIEAAFPNGPGTFGKQKQTAVAQVTKYVYPIGDRNEKISVVGHKTDDGVVQNKYNDFGEPIGPYQVLVIWKEAQPAPLQDDSSVSQTKTKLAGNLRIWAMRGISQKIPIEACRTLGSKVRFGGFNW